MTLLDNSTQINTITPNFVKSHSLVGYIVIWIQVDRVQGYDKDQIALVIPDLSNFVAQVPIILGTPLISHVINVIKEKEIDALAMPLVNARVAYLLTVWWATATIEDSKVVAGESDPSA